MIAVVAEGGGERGLGHFVRAKALADRLHESTEVVLYATGADMPQAWLDEKPAYGMGAVTSTAALRASVQRTAAVVLDCPHYVADVVTGIGASTFICQIDDSVPRYLTADLIVNGHLSARTYPGNAEQLLGTRYALLRRVFATTPVWPVRDSVERVLVYYGGMPPRAFIDDALKYGLIGWDGTVYSVQSTNNHALADWLAALRRADLLVTSASMTALEGLCLNTPTLTYANSGHQATIHEALVDADAVEALSAENLATLVSNQYHREALAANGRALVDGHGVDRVARVLLNRI